MWSLAKTTSSLSIEAIHQWWVGFWDSFFFRVHLFYDSCHLLVMVSFKFVWGIKAVLTDSLRDSGVQVNLQSFRLFRLCSESNWCSSLVLAEIYIMLLRNINSPKSCNGTHLDVQLLLLCYQGNCSNRDRQKGIDVLIYNNVMSIITIDIILWIKATLISSEAQFYHSHQQGTKTIPQN